MVVVGYTGGSEGLREAPVQWRIPAKVIPLGIGCGHGDSHSGAMFRCFEWLWSWSPRLSILLNYCVACDTVLSGHG